MKTSRSLFTIVGLGALTIGLGFAGEPSDPSRDPALSQNRANTTSDPPAGAGHGVQTGAGKERADGKRFDHQPEEHRVSVKSHPPSGAKPADKPHSGPKLPQTFQAKGEPPGEKRASNAQATG